MARTSTCVALLLPLLLVLPACSKGGGDERPASQVTIAASHHMFGSRGRPSFAQFPVLPAFMLSDRGALTLAADSTYTVQQGSGSPSTPQSYALANDGTFTVVVPLASRPAPTHFIGAYALEGDTLAYFFTDRFAPSATGDAVGLIWGTRHTSAMPDLAGDWHVFSLHVIFAPANASQVAGNVGRALGGTIAIDSAGDITGSGKESTTQDVTFTGSADATAVGAVNLELDYTINNTKDTREFVAGSSNTLILGLDEEESDGETGLIGLLRKRTGTKDLTKLAGTYAVGMQTIFVNPVRGGIDAAYGNITFDETDGFELKATGQQNGQAAPFTYTGKYTLADDGTLVLTIPDTQETWMGAVDQEYKVLVLVDNFVEVRTGSELPELSLVLGIRRPAGFTK